MKTTAKLIKFISTLGSIFEEARKQLQKGRGIPYDEFWRQVEQSRRAGRSAQARKKRA
jgi:hypothetical protein